MSELDALKAQQAEVWAMGDYSRVGEMIAEGATALVDAVDIRPGDRVLDVGVGSGSVAVAAARRGGDVVGIDITDAWFDAAHQAAAEHEVTLDLRLGDVEAIEAPAALFDQVLSSFAMIFAPRPDVVAGEVVRVCRPGGTIGFTAWTPGKAIDAVVPFLPPGPEDAANPDLWADSRYVRGLFDGLPVRWHFEQRSLDVTFPSVSAFEDFAFANSGGMIVARGALEAAGTWEQARSALREALDAENLAADGSYHARWGYVLALGQVTGPS